MPINIIKLDRRLLSIHCLVSGPTDAGKTHYAATWPRPYFLSDAPERGYDTIANMNPAHFYERDRPPHVAAINNAQDFWDNIEHLASLPDPKRADAPVRTVIIDGLTHMGDTYLSNLRKDNPGGDGRQAYGETQEFLRSAVQEVKALPFHVVAIATRNDESHGIILPGQKLADKMPGLFSLWLAADVEMGEDGQLRRVMFSRTTMENRARNRFGNRIPAKLPPYYKALEQALFGTTPTKSAPKPRAA